MRHAVHALQGRTTAAAAAPCSSHLSEVEGHTVHNHQPNGRVLRQEAGQHLHRRQLHSVMTWWTAWASAELTFQAAAL